MPKPFLRFTLRWAAASIVVGMLCSCSPGAKKEKLLAKADQYFKGGEYEKAEIEYKNVLLLGQDPRAIGQLGTIYFDQGRLARTSSYLIKAVELQPENLEVRLKAGFLYLSIGNPAKARDAALFILERSPQHAVAPLLLAESVMQVKDLAEARTVLQKLPDSAAVAAALGTLELRTRKMNEAEVLFERARQLDPKLSAAYSGLGQIFAARKDFEKAEKALATAAELSPPRSPYRMQYVQFQLQTGKPDVAKRLLDEIIRATPDFMPSYLLRADIALNEKKYDESITLVESALGRESIHHELLLLAARAYMEKGDKDKALATVEKASSTFPGSPQVYVQMGRIYMAKGDPNRAAASYTEAIKQVPGFPAAVLGLAQVQILQRDFNPAIVALKALLKQNPKHVEAHVLLADAYRNQGSVDEALALYRQLIQEPNGNPQIQLIIGSLLLQQNKKAEARETFGKALQVAPDFLAATEQLVNLDILDKQYGAAVARVEAQIARTPTNAKPYLLMAKIQTAQGTPEKAEAALQKAIELEPGSFMAYMLLARMYLDTKQPDKALAKLEAVAAKNPNDSATALLVGIVHEQKGNYQAARDSYEKALAIDPKVTAALNNLAYLLSERFNEQDKAVELAQRARDLSPNQPESADTLGWVLYRKGQYARAAGLLEEGAARLTENPDAQYHLGMAHYMMGQEEAARPVLERALQLSPTFSGHEQARAALALLSLDVTKAPDKARPLVEQALALRKDDPIAQSRLAALHEHEGKPEKALAVYESMVEANPGNANAAVNAIRLYESRKDTAKALELAKATRVLVPGDGRLAHAVGRLSFQSGNRTFAVGVLQDAARRQSGDPEVLFDLAEASYSIGQVDAAETALREALALTPTFPRATRARQYLELIDAAKNPATAAASAKSIEAALKADGSNVVALMAQGAVDEQKGDAKAAKQHYEKALARFPEFMPAARQLAIIYSSLGDDDKKALEMATRAREAYPSDRLVAKANGIILYRSGNYPRAVNLLVEAARGEAADAEALYYLGMSQQKLKDQAAGTRTLQRALEAGLSGTLEAEARKAIASTGK